MSEILRLHQRPLGVEELRVLQHELEQSPFGHELGIARIWPRSGRDRLTRPGGFDQRLIRIDCSWRDGGTGGSTCTLTIDHP